MENKYDLFLDLVKKAADTFTLKKLDSVLLVSHLDADGISSAAITVFGLELININYTVKIVPNLDKEKLLEISRMRYDSIIFTDLGSGVISNIERILPDRNILILDHHKPEKESNEKIIHVNPHLVSIDGGSEISGSGVSYYFFRAINEKIKAMAGIALVGAVGDLQHSKGFLELNKKILGDARPLLEIRESENGTSYRFISESENELNTVSKFATVLNACGRLSKASIGIGACLGDKKQKGAAVDCLFSYREEISKAMHWYAANKKSGNIVVEEGYIIINAKDKVLATIIGTISSMISKGEAKGKYVLSLGRLDNITKVSLRFGIQRESVDLRSTMKEIIEKLGEGEYGGHKYAAGAVISIFKENEFIEIAKQILNKKSIEEDIS